MKSPGCSWRALLILAMTALGLASTSVAGAASRPDWGELLRQSPDWYASQEGRRIAENILSYQTAAGDWPKNTDTVSSPYQGAAKDLRGTFDNGATVRELRFLARFAKATGAPSPSRSSEALTRGLRHLLDAQYPNGGWPQSHPPGNGYARHITFNDDTMIRLLELARDTATSPDFAWLDPSLRERAATAYQRAIECILRCQVHVNGQLTVWCAQHDEKTFEPRPARTFEPASLSGSESARILRHLMTLPNPSPEVVESIRAGVAWFETAKITGIQVVTRDGDRIVEPDPSAPPVWARFYQVDSNRPLFTGRDGIPRERLADIELERRTGYAWYGTWGEHVARDYAEWSARLEKSGAGL